MNEENYWEDKQLSWKSKGILSYLLHCNKDATTKDILSVSKDKSTSVYSGITELEIAGYLKRYLVRNELGHFKNYKYTARGKIE